jgi:adenylate cyclase
MPAHGLGLVTGERRRRWPEFVERLLALGTEGYPPKVRRRLLTLNVMAYLIVVLSTLYAALYAIDDFGKYWPVVLVNICLGAMGACVPFAHRLHELAGAVIIVVFESLALFALVAVIGRQSGIQLNFVVGASAPFLIFGMERMGLILPVVLLSLGLHVTAWFMFPPEAALVSVAPELIRQLYVSSAVSAFAVTAAISYYAFHLAGRAEAETEAVLRNILPDSIVERLKTRPGEPIADSFPEVSVLFADIKGFVALAGRLGPERTVAMLNDLIRGFDALAAEHGIEKIKTIGDCYMAVAGLPAPVPYHATQMARMALAMRDVADETAERFGIAVSLRIGMAIGPVMAGVIGARKFTYDVWGDAVNLAARLENTGEADRIHVSAAMRARLADDFDFAYRGSIDIKGAGPHETYFLVGMKPHDRPVRTAAQ